MSLYVCFKYQFYTLYFKYQVYTFLNDDDFFTGNQSFYNCTYWSCDKKKKYLDCVDNIYINEDDETPIILFDKVYNLL